ncbi:hypothetical protein OC842_001706, partial [Tilletia horrida]
CSPLTAHPLGRALVEASTKDQMVDVSGQVNVLNMLNISYLAGAPELGYTSSSLESVTKSNSLSGQTYADVNQ